MQYLLDTNICIYLMKRQPPEVLARLESLQRGAVVMSVVTYAELRAGLKMQGSNRRQNEQALSVLTGRIPVMTFDEDAAVAYGVVRAAVSDRRRDALDRLIAAHAVSLNLVLITNNEADFAGYPGLKVENWVNQA